MCSPTSLIATATTHGTDVPGSIGSEQSETTNKVKQDTSKDRRLRPERSVTLTLILQPLPKPSSNLGITRLLLALADACPGY